MHCNASISKGNSYKYDKIKALLMLTMSVFLQPIFCTFIA